MGLGQPSINFSAVQGFTHGIMSFVLGYSLLEAYEMQVFCY